MRWKIDGELVPKNPAEFSKKPTKNIEYRKTIFGQDVRISSVLNPVTIDFEVRWIMVNQEFHDKLYSLYKTNTPFFLETHLERDAWTVMIKTFTAEYTIIGDQPRSDYYDINLTLSSVQGVI